MKKVAIFADVQNIYYTTRSAFKRNFDYNQFWATATDGKEVVAAYAYAIDRGDDKQKQFQNILRGIGFEVKLKPFIQRADGSAKGDWDVGIAVDMMDIAEQVDEIILLSGDGDFDILLKRVHDKHDVTTTVFGVESLTALSLVKFAQHFVAIDNSLLL